jgi:hypothetical protein
MHPPWHNHHHSLLLPLLPSELVLLLHLLLAQLLQ